MTQAKRDRVTILADASPKRAPQPEFTREVAQPEHVRLEPDGHTVREQCVELRHAARLLQELEQAQRQLDAIMSIETSSDPAN